MTQNKYYTKEELIEVIKRYQLDNCIVNYVLNWDNIIDNLRIKTNKIPISNTILDFYNLNSISELFTNNITKKQRSSI